MMDAVKGAVAWMAVAVVLVVAMAFLAVRPAAGGDERQPGVTPKNDSTAL